MAPPLTALILFSGLKFSAIDCSKLKRLHLHSTSTYSEQCLFIIANCVRGQLHGHGSPPPQKNGLKNIYFNSALIQEFLVKIRSTF